MKPSSVVTRDLLGPRNSLPSYRNNAKNLMKPLVRLQKRQLEKNEKQCVKKIRRATAFDVNDMFQWSFIDAIEWASQFDPFSQLSNEHQNCLISEYGFAFFIIDQGFISASESKTGYWFLQNGTYLHLDYYRGSENNETKVDHNVARKHYEFVNFLETSIKLQFQTLQIDWFETAVLKCLLLLSNSYPKQNIFNKSQDSINSFKNKCLEELMEYLMKKIPDSYHERFGQLIIFLGEIRIAIKVVYNQTKVSDLFDPLNFNLYVRSFFLS